MIKCDSIQDLEQVISNLFDDQCGYKYEEIATVIQLKACSRSAKWVKENVFSKLEDKDITR